VLLFTIREVLNWNLINNNNFGIKT
jgi:hypothetical protein